MLKSEMNLKNRAAIVTGGTKGIGRGIAEEQRREGVSVCVAVRHQAEIDETIKELNQGDEVGTIDIACNVRDYDQVRALIDYAVNELSSLRIHIDNASIKH